MAAPVQVQNGGGALRAFRADHQLERGIACRLRQRTGMAKGHAGIH
jgi:hypothetical protein